MPRNTGQWEKKSYSFQELRLKGKHLCGAQAKMEGVEIAANILRSSRLRFKALFASLTFLVDTIIQQLSHQQAG